MNALPRPCPERERLLHSFADGELDAANTLAVEDHLRSCEGCAAAYGEIVRHKQLLKRDALRFRAPPDLRERILSMTAGEDAEAPRHNLQNVGSTGMRRWRFSQAAAVFSAMALAASLILFLNSPVQTPGIDSELVAAHVRSLLVSHLTDVSSSDQHTVKPWFLGKLGFAPSVIDLKQSDYPLIGGRLDYIGGRVVAAIVYKRRNHVINLFVWPASYAEGSTKTLDGYHILSWTQGGFTYSAVSDLDITELRQFQHTLENALT